LHGAFLFIFFPLPFPPPLRQSESKLLLARCVRARIAIRGVFPERARALGTGREACPRQGDVQTAVRQANFPLITPHNYSHQLIFFLEGRGEGIRSSISVLLREVRWTCQHKRPNPTEDDGRRDVGRAVQPRWPNVLHLSRGT
jgi:hypothetical protein